MIRNTSALRATSWISSTRICPVPRISGRETDRGSAGRCKAGWVGAVPGAARARSVERVRKAALPVRSPDKTVRCVPPVFVPTMHACAGRRFVDSWCCERTHGSRVHEGIDFLKPAAAEWRLSQRPRSRSRRAPLPAGLSVRLSRIVEPSRVSVPWSAGRAGGLRRTAMIERRLRNLDRW